MRATTCSGPGTRAAKAKDAVSVLAGIGAAATMFEEGEAAILTDGHTFTVRRGEVALSYLDGVLDQATALQEAALGITKEVASVVPSAFTARYAEALTELGVMGANPNPFFTAMVAKNQLREIGLRPESAGAWTRPGPGPRSSNRRRCRSGCPRPRDDPRRGRDDALEAAGPRQDPGRRAPGTPTRGVGAALMMPVSATIVLAVFPEGERGRVMAIYAGISQVFLALGPLVGGLLTE